MANQAEYDYGPHRALRRACKRMVDRGGVACWRCGKLIDPLEPWDLGHDDDDRRVWRGPEHRRCNRATSGRRRKASRAW